MRGKNHRKIDAVDIFCGIGGLTHGLRLAGISVNAGVDVDPSCRYAYEANNSKSTFITADIRDIKFKDLATYYQSTNITALVGCAPCQPFSAYNRGKKVSNTDCSLIGEFARLIEEGTPDLISMENVPGLIKGNYTEKLTGAGLYRILPVHNPPEPIYKESDEGISDYLVRLLQEDSCTARTQCHLHRCPQGHRA